MKNVRLLIIGIFLSFSHHLLHAQNPVVSPEVRQGGLAAQKQVTSNVANRGGC